MPGVGRDESATHASAARPRDDYASRNYDSLAARARARVRTHAHLRVPRRPAWPSDPDACLSITAIDVIAR